MLGLRWLISLVLAVTIADVFFSTVAADPGHSVRVGLHAAWPSSQPHFEAAEWISEHFTPQLFWAFVQNIADKSTALRSEAKKRSDREIYEPVLSALRDVLANDWSSSASDIAIWALTARLMSPRVRIHFAAANETLSRFDYRGTASRFPFAVISLNSPAKISFSPSLPSLCSLIKDIVGKSLCDQEDSTANHDEWEHRAWQSFDNSFLDLVSHFPGEHRYPQIHCASKHPALRVILYADPGDSSFLQWHRTLVRGSADCLVEYSLRFWDGGDTSDASKPMPVLQGYAVEVALKATEYKAQDDIVFEKKLFTDCPYGNDSCTPSEKVLADFEKGAIDLDAFERDNIGLLVADHVITHAEGKSSLALSQIRDLAEELPFTLHALSKQFDTGTIPNSRMENLEQAATKARSIPRLVEGIYVNGRLIPATEIVEDLAQPLACFSGIASAENLLHSAFSKDSRVADHIPKILKVHKIDGTDDLRVDYSQNETFTNIPVWFNDLRKDSRYKEWLGLESDTGSTFVSRVRQIEIDERSGELLSGDKAGLVQVRSNIVSLLIVLDLGAGGHLAYIPIIESVVYGLIPMRIGIIAVPTSRSSALTAALFYHCLGLGGLKTGLKFLKVLRQLYSYFGGGLQDTELSEDFVELVFQQLLHSGEKFKFKSVGAIFEQDEVVRDRLQDIHQWAINIGLISPREAMNWKLWSRAHAGETSVASKPSLPVTALLNGIVVNDIGSETIKVAVGEQRRIASLLTSDTEIPSDTEINEHSHWLYDDDSLLILDKLDIAGQDDHAGSSQARSGPNTNPRASPDGLCFPSIVKSFVDVREIRYAGSFGSESNSKSETDVFTLTIWLWSRNESSDEHVSALSKLEVLHQSGFLRKCRTRFAVITASSAAPRVLESLKDAARSETVLVINGLIYPSSSFSSASDLQVIIARESRGLGPAVLHASAGQLNSDEVLLGVLAVREISSRCGASLQSSNRLSVSSSKPADWSDILQTLQRDRNSANPLIFSSESNGDTLDKLKIERSFSVAAVLDPLGKHLSHMSEFLHALSVALGPRNIDLTLLLLPPLSTRDRLTKSRPVFSRTVYSPVPAFDDASGQLISPAAEFSKLPQSLLLTLSVRTPRSWFVAPYATNYDLDNVMLSMLSKDVPVLHAEFALESLLVEGSCIDQDFEPPQGLRLQMTNRGTTEVDTLVMANLGYFQLKTPQPGLWKLDIATGRDQTLFDIASVDQEGISVVPYKLQRTSAFTFNGTGHINVIIDSLNGARNTLLRVQRKPGTEKIPLLDPDRRRLSYGAKSSVMSNILRNVHRFVGRRSLQSTEPQHHSAVDYIHVFSVASGHLYERFLKIMMLSVKKHASLHVKFWLLENYLSPSFKKVIPIFARKHKFEVEMVTYKWPSWLREQTEKQRIIWAYKILFLDVLFPLNLSRVIFVDSDQVVRADLAELMRMDLHGAPYGYVPFCDSRKEVEGFRFWKTGFWKDTLQGAHYHISALYVVDLDLFRESSAGDTLRFVYQSLSADPNSLSNLDQDLPNYAAVSPAGGGRTVPIFDLPQEWLWCESWCDDASKADAKTIDLCNNPMTKEPKLSSARRIISEWVSLDDEAYNTTLSIHDDLMTCEIASQKPTDTLQAVKETNSIDNGNLEKDEL